jgi:hypothetical protein
MLLKLSKPNVMYRMIEFVRQEDWEILINKPTNVMQLGAIVFIIPWKALYMFWVLFTPIIRSVLKLYMQLLVQSCIGVASDPVCYKMIRSRERAARWNYKDLKFSGNLLYPLYPVLYLSDMFIDKSALKMSLFVC